MVLALLAVMSSSALIRPTAVCSSHECVCHRSWLHDSSSSPSRLLAKKNNKSSEEIEESKSGRFFGLFTNSKEKQVEKEEPKEVSSGILNSLSKRLESARESREAKNKAKKDAKLAEVLERESRKSGMVSFPSFNTTGVVSAFRNVSVGFGQANDGIRGIRTNQNALTEEAVRLEKLRKRAEAEKARRAAAQQVADQRATARREKREENGNEIGRAKDDGPSINDGSDGSEKRFNPLSVAQKYMSGIFDTQKDKEEWLVVAPKTRISPGEMVPVTAAGLDLLLVASKDGSALYCIANSCPHLGTPLEVGMLERRPIESPLTPFVDSTIGDEEMPLLQETDIASLLAQDGCEDCIVCPLHKTAFALESGEVRGEWCPYPPVIGKMMGAIKSKSSLPTFDVRTKGKNIEVRINSPFQFSEQEEIR